LVGTQRRHAQIILPFMANTQTVLIIGLVWPEPDSSAAGSRMMQLISMFLEQNWKVTFASTASESTFRADIETMGVDIENIVLNDGSFDDFINKLNPSIVVFDRFMSEEQFGWRVAKHAPEALRILNSEDLHCLRRSRQKAVLIGKPFSIENLLEEDDAKREIASLLRCDLAVVISEFEIRLLSEFFKIDTALLHYLPLFCGPEDAKSLPDFEQRNHFVFIGNFFHEPNVDAVKYLKQILWTKIRKQMPLAEVHVYGAYPSEFILQMNQPKEKFFVHGRAEDAKAVVKKARVVLAPIRFGAGIKGKLLEAMQCGTPSITTSVGAEAIAGTLAWNGFVSDDPEEMAKHATLLYNDKTVWLDAQQKGFTILNERFQKRLFEEDFINKILDVQDNLTSHRKNNFLGAMLQFHTMRSTEYLSRWIEEKNKS
jgi:glycosyltransferase involved in cell wall biosynthesis